MENQEKTKNVKVETYSEDMTKAIESIGMNDGGFVKKIIHEQETNDLKKENFSPNSKRNQIFIYVGFILIILSVLSLISAILLRKSISTVSVAPQYKPLIFTDQNKLLEIDGFKKEKIIQTVLSEFSKIELKSGSIGAFYFTNNKKVVGTREFLKNVEANIDTSKITYLDDNFLLGVTNLESKNLFVLLKMRSVSDIFNDIRLWESNMFYDLHGFFGVEANADTKYLFTKDFEDGIIQNKNARILKDNEGKIVLMYVYANDASIVISDSVSSASEIMKRLSASQIEK